MPLKIWMLKTHGGPTKPRKATATKPRHIPKPNAVPYLILGHSDEPECTEELQWRIVEPRVTYEDVDGIDDGHLEATVMMMEPQYSPLPKVSRARCTSI